MIDCMVQLGIEPIITMMMGMYWMAGGMLAQAVVDLVYHFWPNRKKC